jgi:hypothetical protein
MIYKKSSCSEWLKRTPSSPAIRIRTLEQQRLRQLHSRDVVPPLIWIVVYQESLARERGAIDSLVCGLRIAVSSEGSRVADGEWAI